VSRFQDTVNDFILKVLNNVLGQALVLNEIFHSIVSQILRISHLFPGGSYPSPNEIYSFMSNWGRAKLTICIVIQSSLFGLSGRPLDYLFTSVGKINQYSNGRYILRRGENIPPRVVKTKFIIA
jgi:hypothetical protein